LWRKVRQVCDRGLRCRSLYLPTLVSLMSMPSLSNSPWIGDAPQRGFSRRRRRIRSRTSRERPGRPDFPQRTFHVQKRRKPWRCRPITVSGLTMASAERQSRQIRHRTTHKNRSTGFKRGRFFAVRRRTQIWCGSARISSSRPLEIETRIAQQRAKAESGASRKALRGGDQLSSSETDRSLR
jgi:hypothetical protein